jgi:hypothetical protein
MQPEPEQDGIIGGSELGQGVRGREGQATGILAGVTVPWPIFRISDRSTWR